MQTPTSRCKAWYTGQFLLLLISLCTPVPRSCCLPAPAFRLSPCIPADKSGKQSLTLMICLAVQLEVQHEVDGWYQVVNRAGATGLVPASFIRLLAAGEASPAAVGAAGAAFSSATGPLPKGNSALHLVPCLVR